MSYDSYDMGHMTQIIWLIANITSSQKISKFDFWEFTVFTHLSPISNGVPSFSFVTCEINAAVSGQPQSSGQLILKSGFSHLSAALRFWYENSPIWMKNWISVKQYLPPPHVSIFYKQQKNVSQSRMDKLPFHPGKWYSKHLFSCLLSHHWHLESCWYCIPTTNRHLISNSNFFTSVGY